MQCLIYRQLPFHINMDLAVNLADTTSRYFLENMGHHEVPEPIKIIIIKRRPDVLRI